MKHRNLFSGWLALAGAGASAVAGGHADSWGRSILYVAIGCMLAFSGFWLLSKMSKKTGAGRTLDPRFRELSEVSGMTNEHFVAWYQPIAEKQTQSTVAFATRVLKQRRGRIFGMENGHEAARRNRDRWTYTVFLAAVAQVSANQRAREKGLATLLLTIPESACEWLQREPKIVDTLTNAILSPSARNPVWQLIDDARERPNESAKQPIAPQQQPDDSVNVRQARLPPVVKTQQKRRQMMQDFTDQRENLKQSV